MKFLERVSRYRTELMGIAILWILFFHMDIRVGSGVLRYFKDSGYAGVDIFFLVSGFGLACGWFKKQLPLPDFYRKRFIRLVPSYLIVVFFFILYQAYHVNTWGFITTVKTVTGLNFFIDGELFFWFIPAISVCYLFFPVLISLLDTRQAANRGLRNYCICIIICFLICLSVSFTPFFYLLVFLIRVPIFITGMLMGLLYSGKSDYKMALLSSTTYLVILFFAGFVIHLCFVRLYPVMTLWRWGLWWYPFWFMCLPMCYSFTWLIEKMTQAGIMLRLLNFIRFCGITSLEIYVIQSLIFTIKPWSVLKYLGFEKIQEFNFKHIPENIIYCILIFLMSLSLKKVADKIQTYLRTESTA